MTQGWTTRLAWTLSGTLALAAFSGLAAGNPERPKLDTNGDGAIDLAEMQVRHPDFTAEKFGAADTDHNGQLSREELRAVFDRHHDKPKLDTDDDGAVSLEELQKAHPDVDKDKFATYDADRDGKLTGGELKQGFRNEMFSRLDRDSNGGVSLIEMQSVRSSVTPEKFARMDTDGNGLLSQQELRAAHKGHRHEPPAAGVKPPQP